MPLILMIIGLILIIYNYRAIKKENGVEREEDILNISFQSVLQDNKEELNDYKMEIGLLRRDIAESLTELQEEIIDIKNNLNRLKNNKKMYENKEELENKDFLTEDDIDSNINGEYNKVNEQKVEEINEMHDSINEISENLLVDSDIMGEIISEIDFLQKADSSKTQNIKRLLEDGLTEEQICHELSVSKGEILLVKGLFKR
ncbi:hypothetical protein psyc5s11_46430 [Clostridium gelidum]|uniref:Uncharacterized protein n=1 Tax=Clostridium gelidum TaxID=704125 RepID=A0ABN6J2K1_9CLOT|nr:hypothetical protein [Clostridium gelidum]BCZ48576.1 hypothetical protein psyc5s11_46430 [Clostridium gelidum]